MGEDVKEGRMERRQGRKKGRKGRKGEKDLIVEEGRKEESE